MMDEKKFKQSHKPPACTTQPWKYLIPSDIRDETLRKIRQETTELYGYSMDECTKRKVCFTKSCMGRELPWKSPTALPYLEQLKVTHNIKNDELFIANCDECPIKLTCKSTCYQVNDWLNRGMDREPDLLLQENIENHVVEPVMEVTHRESLFGNEDIPWDCLSESKQDIVKKYLYEGKDFLTISKEMDLNNQSRVKYEFYSALTRLSKFAVIRKFINNNKEMLMANDQYNLLESLFIKGLSITELAEKRQESKQAVQQALTRLIKRYNVRWTIFVRKRNNKVIYNVPELFK